MYAVGHGPCLCDLQRRQVVCSKSRQQVRRLTEQVTPGTPQKRFLLLRFSPQPPSPPGLSKIAHPAGLQASQKLSYSAPQKRRPCHVTVTATPISEEDYRREARRIFSGQKTKKDLDGQIHTCLPQGGYFSAQCTLSRTHRKRCPFPTLSCTSQLDSHMTVSCRGNLSTERAQRLEGPSALKP